MVLKDPLTTCVVWSKNTPACRELVEKLAGGLRRAGHAVCEPGEQATAGRNAPAIVVFDEMDEWSCALIRQAGGQGAARLLAVTGCGSRLNGGAWRALEVGASDVLAWDEMPDPLAAVLARLQRWAEVDRILESPEVRGVLIGDSPQWLAVLRQVVEAACFSDAPILLTGETGTGKELVAHLVHRLDRKRSLHAMIVVDCTTIVPDLSGSELFGHERGAYTGAVNPRDGAFALANQGTLFLDEVGELPPVLQMQLLRVLQEQTYKRVGSNTWQKTDFRLVCATNRDLPGGEAGFGRFRSDLYYRISNWKFHLPPLRERCGDILALARHFLAKALGLKTQPPHAGVPEIDERVQDYLLRREYPGNIRDLRNLMFRIAARHVGPGPVSIGDIPEDERPREHLSAQEEPAGRAATLDQAVQHAVERGYSLKELSNIVKDQAMRAAIDAERGNLQRAANRLGVSDRLLQKWRAGKLEDEYDDR